MSGVKNITLSYQEYKSYVRQNKDSRLADRSYSMDPANGQGDGSLLGSAVYRDVRTGENYELKAVYDERFTSDSPLIKVTADRAGGKKQEYMVNIDEIDVNAASDIEMFALCNYIDAHEGKAEHAGTSWDALRAYVRSSLTQAEADSLGQKRDWLTMVGEEKGAYMESKLYRQVTDGNKLICMLEKYGMPKEVKMIQIGNNVLVPVDNGMQIQDVDGGYARMIFDNKGEIRYENNLNREAGWSMEVSHEMLKKAQYLGAEFAMFMSDQGFWESYLNGDADVDVLKSAMNYKAVQSDLFEYLPEPVRQAWNRAAGEAGTDGLGMGENGTVQYPSELMTRYMSALMKGESTRICGDTVESVLEFARTALSHLEDKHQPRYSDDVQAFKDKEVRFYRRLIDHLM